MCGHLVCDPRRVSDPDWFALLTATDGYGLGEPTPTETLDQAEATIGVSLPPSLRALYRVTDGVLDKPGEWQVIWPVDQLVQRNLDAYATEGSARFALVGFGDDGTGSPFCFHRDEGEAVYSWSPIEHQATWLAADATDFWTRWTTDQLPPH